MNREAKVYKDDIVERVYFITKLVQNQNGNTMQGALTSKSDSMGGIFDRFINTISDSLIFDKIILPQIETNKKTRAISDYYYYKPTKSVAGIAPDLFGLNIDGTDIAFTQFNNKWEPVPGMPQVEVKTFKAKDQMITLRDQEYKEYLVFVDFDLRIDYLVPFLDSNILNDKLVSKMKMNRKLFIKEDKKSKITEVNPINYSSDEIGNMKLLSITNAMDFKKQATYCGGHISVRRMKSINVRKINIKSHLLHDKLSIYVKKSKRIEDLYEFNELWRRKQTNIDKNTELLDFSADKIDKIEICKFNNNSIVITALEDGCSFNGTQLKVGKQYTVEFATLDRSGNDGEEFFMQKQCAVYLKGLEKQLINELKKIINSVDI